MYCGLEERKEVQGSKRKKRNTVEYISINADYFSSMYLLMQEKL
jgi:hypothetical protein